MRCQKCGQPHENSKGTLTCAGHRSTGVACRAYPIRGARVCRVHGGSAPAVRKRAADRLALRREGRKIGDLLAEQEVHNLHPLEGLLDAVRRTSGMVRVLGDLLSERSANGIDDGDGARELTRMYGEWSRLNAQVSKMALDARLDERLLDPNEVTVSILFEAVERALAQAGIPASYAIPFRHRLGAELRRAGGRPPIDLDPAEEPTPARGPVLAVTSPETGPASP